MNSKKKTVAARTVRPAAEPTNGAHDLSPEHSTLITSHRKTEKETFALYESTSGDFFVQKRDESGESITPVTCDVAGKILSYETRRHMGRIFKQKLEAPVITTFEKKTYDTTKDTLVWMEFDDDVEAAAVYRTVTGRE